MLGALGLDHLQTSVYDELVGVPSASDAELAARLDLPLSKVQAALVALSSLGLVSRSSVRPEQVSAVPPDVGLGSLLAQRRAALLEAERAIPALTSRYRAVATGRHGAEVVDWVHGSTAVDHRISQLHREARAELLTVVPAPSPPPHEDTGAGLGTGTADRGVDHRVLVPRSWLERPGSLDLVDAAERLGEHVRVVDSVPLRLVVADRELAVVAVHDPHDPTGRGGLLVHPSALLDGLVALFELMWGHGHQVAVRADEGPRSPLHDLDQRVLALLLAGLTDESIGRQLGVSLRTVQRRARSLMDAARVTTRLQLGYEAARRGWI